MIQYTDQGEMWALIDFLDPAVDPNADGSMSAPSTFAAGIQAKVEALSAREEYKSQQVISEVEHRFTILYIPGLKNRFFIMFDGRVFQIKAIMDPDERKVELRIIAIERDDGQL